MQPPRISRPHKPVDSSTIIFYSVFSLSRLKLLSVILFAGFDNFKLVLLPILTNGFGEADSTVITMSSVTCEFTNYLGAYVLIRLQEINC